MKDFCLYGRVGLGLVACLAVPCCLAPPCFVPPEIIFVNANATSGGDGFTWDTAFPDPQAALTFASQSAGAVKEIWVAAGTYRPAGADGDRAATFQLCNGVAIRGGFAGSESSLDQRDVAANVTVLSGDLNGDDVGLTNTAENSYHVVTGSETDATAILDGFTISGGNANAEKYSSGAGMINNQGSPTIINCTFSGNAALTSGGGMLNYNSGPSLTDCSFIRNRTLTAGGGLANLNSDSTLTGCAFTDNSALSNGGGVYNYSSNAQIVDCSFDDNSASSGGGMYNREASSPIVKECSFTNNASDEDGGAVANDIGSNTVLVSCTFSRNSARRFGGAVFNTASSDAIITSCTFSGNSALSAGGGVSNYESSPTLTNCVFSGNTATSGGGIHNRTFSSPAIVNCTLGQNSASVSGGGVYVNLQSTPTLTNCILWQNSDLLGSDESAQIHIDDGSAAVSYCCVQGGWTGEGGTGNIGEDPLFVDVDGGDDLAGTDDDNLRLAAGSPCIDAANNTAVPPDAGDLDGDGNTDEQTPLDRDGTPRFADDPSTPDVGAGAPPVVDMGAYEFQP